MDLTYEDYLEFYTHFFYSKDYDLWPMTSVPPSK